MSKFPSPPEQQQLLADYLPYSQTVSMPESMPPVPECRDQYDLMFMRLAVVGQASVLVSGDKDLLSLADEFKQMPDFPILSIEAFFRNL